MTGGERRARLMALMARRDLALHAQAFVASQTAAQDAAAMTDRIRALLDTRATPAAEPMQVGALSAALWLGNALQAELGRSALRTEQAEAEAAADRTRVAAASAVLRHREDRTAQTRRAAQDAQETRADAERAERPNRGR